METRTGSSMRIKKIIKVTGTSVEEVNQMKMPLFVAFPMAREMWRRTRS